MASGKTVWWPEFCGDNSTLYNAFWSDELSINTESPDFTRCFQSTVFTWLPCGVLLLCTPYYFYSLLSRTTKHRCSNVSKLNLAKSLLAAALFVTTLVDFIYEISVERDWGGELNPSDYVAYVMKLAALLIVTILTPLEFMKGCHSTGFMFLFWFFHTIFEALIFYSTIHRWNIKDPNVHEFYYTCQITYFTGLLLEFILNLFADLAAFKDSHINTGPKAKPVQIKGLHEQLKHIALAMLIFLVSRRYSILGDGRIRNGSKVDGETEPLLNGSLSGTKKGLEEAEEFGTVHEPCAELSAPFWKKLIFMWLTSWVIKGYKKPLTFEDLTDIRMSEKCETLVPLFEDIYYKKEADGSRSKTGAHRGLFSSLFRSIWPYFVISSFYRLLAIPVSFVNPQILSLLISFVERRDPYLWKGIFLAVLMLVVNFTNSVLIHNFLNSSVVAGMQARSMVNAAVYRKALRLSSAAKRQSTVGQIVNLMSVDAQKVQDFYLYTTLLWTVPLLIALATYFLWMELGPSCLAGFAVLLVLVPLNALYFARKAMKLQVNQMKQKDSRFKLMNEILAGIKVLKLYAWEGFFQQHVLDCREKELRDIKYANYINAFGSMCWLLSPYLVSLACFTAYTLSSEDNILTAEKAFVTISLINLLNWPMSLLPLGVNNTVQGIVSIRRIGRFLDLEELQEDTTVYGTCMEKNALEINDGTFTWGKDERPVLKDINLKVKRGSLVAVVGQVGCGKSSLVSSFLGELRRVRGSSFINGSLAYVPQQAWIQNMSLRDNILFGKPWIESKYQGLIDACALRPDLAILPGGDKIEIGEKGINVSGGQKQRISLARACYQSEDIYLLDDPLSAVDAHVGKHIFDKVIGPEGILKDKTRLLVTHGLGYLPNVDLILVMGDGCIKEVGKYQELLDKNGDFAEFVANYQNDEMEEEESASEPEPEPVSAGERERSGHYSGEERKLSSHRKLSTRRRQSQPRRKSSVKRKQSDLEESVLTKARQRRASKAQLIATEHAETGNVRLHVIGSYVRAGTMLMFGLVVVAHALFIVAQILTNIWLSDWSNDPVLNNTMNAREQTNYRLSIYGALGGAQTLCALIEAFAVAQGAYMASKYFHEKLVDRILHAPMSFFDTTPLGRIMNRFSKDLDVLDANMPLFVRQWLFAMAPVVTTVVLICYSTPIFTAVMVPLLIMFVVLQRLYIATARQLKRIDSVRRSPIYVHFDESVVGASSIRAYRKEDQFVEKCDRLVDNSQMAWYIIMISYRWCGICMEFIGSCIVFFASLFAVLQGDTISAGLAGLSVSYSLQITVYMNALIRNSSEMETYVVSVERIDEYLNIASEAPWVIPDHRPPRDWPTKGTVKFENYSTRYRPGLELVLKDVNFDVQHAEKIGIVGRTGAGKSSLSLALFRLIEASMGQVSIDGQVCGYMGLHDLRSKLSIIPQDPVIFSGTLRRNLDPFDKYSDGEIWNALEHAHLKDFVTDLPELLQYECGEGGEALSVGQRQLVCLARALLRHSKILVLDEATAAVDLETDALIQNTIRSQFKDCTILTVAHRLSTVLDYDRIMVLDKGRIVEFDTPAALLKNKKTIFHSMARDAGITGHITTAAS